MFNTPACTLAETVRVTGTGLHGGRPCTVTLKPAEPGHGRVFLHAGRRWPAHWTHARTPGGSTHLGPVATVEHLLAALVVRGVTDVDIHVEGTEIPALDGSAAGWDAAIGEPVVHGTSTPWTLDQPLRVEADGGWIHAEPADTLSLDVRIAYPGLRQQLRLATPDLPGVLGARTFTLHRRLGALVAAGHGRGLRPGTIVVWGPRGPLVPLRADDEPVRHKALDILGDLALAGCPVLASITAERSSHALHLAFVRAWAHARSRSRSGSSVPTPGGPGSAPPTPTGPPA
jgi:UDP-3-O-[3-hydroxymyristoyl] N-acetylglucosamine deacetylase